ncbi:hypothetical protein KCU90_g22234, partial [Aureobasidium melanogenum]
LDDWAVPAAKPKMEDAKAESSTPSMLDQWTSPAPFASKTVAEPPASMLDEWTAPVAKPTIESAEAAPPSLLDQWTTVSPVSSNPVPTVAEQLKEPVVTSSESAVKSSQFLANPTMPTSMPNSANDDARPDDTTVNVQDNGAPKSELSEKELQNNKDSRAETQETSQTGKMGDEKAEEYKLPKGLKQPPPEAFKEPDPNSLLDAFGF